MKPFAIIAAIFALAAPAVANAADNRTRVVGDQSAFACASVEPFVPITKLVKRVDMVNLNIYMEMLIGAGECQWLDAGTKVEITPSIGPLARVTKNGAVLYLIPSQLTLTNDGR